MTRKTAAINLLVTPDTKAKLKAKAEDLGVSLTGLLEKLAQEQVIFADANLRSMLNLLTVRPNDK